MEPVTIAIICATAFGIVSGIAAFVRQLLLSRDKKLNDQAQQKALTLEANELEKIRNQMAEFKRFDSHYQVLGKNKEAIQYIDEKIEIILRKKYELIDRYASLTLKESAAIISGQSAEERKCIFDKLKTEIDDELAFYQTELQQLQKRRANLWDAHTGLQGHIIEQEKLRNSHLDSLYEHHTNVLEKVYLRHNENSEAIAKQSIDAGTQTFKTMLTTPLETIMGLFKASTGISAGAPNLESVNRDAVSQAESALKAANSSSNALTNLSGLQQKKYTESAG